MKNTNKFKLLLFLFPIFLIAISLTPSTASAVGYTYSVEGGRALMGIKDMPIIFSGYIKIELPPVDPNYIDDLIYNGATGFGFVYTISDSCLISTIDNSVITSGSGFIEISYYYLDGYWENFNTWYFGDIFASHTGGHDVIFDEKEPVSDYYNDNIDDIACYDTLPSNMVLINGMIYLPGDRLHEPSWINLKLTLDKIELPTPVPEPATFFLLLTGIKPFLFKIKSPFSFLKRSSLRIRNNGIKSPL